MPFQRAHVFTRPRSLFTPAVPHLSPTILHADDALVVADKPAGLLSMPAGGEGRQDCLARRVRERYPNARLVHRLDMATSGVIVLGRGPEMVRRLNRAFAERVIDKRYVAVVHGHLPDDEGEIDLPLAPDPKGHPFQRVDHRDGLPALSRYRVIERSGTRSSATTRVELKPVTGRTHQLRVHLMSIGHPIVGDPLYGPTGPQPISRMLLHAAAIHLIHPRRRVPVRYASPIPF